MNDDVDLSDLFPLEEIDRLWLVLNSCLV